MGGVMAALTVITSKTGALSAADRFCPDISTPMKSVAIATAAQMTLRDTYFFISSALSRRLCKKSESSF
jgi:hypothetical protein